MDREHVPSGLPGFGSQRVALDDVELHYVLGGSGPTLVLLHGFAQTWRAWRGVMPRLAERYTVIAPDLRGVGGSSVPLGGFDKRTMAGDLAGLLDALDLKSAGVVGHDIGGMVAYAFAKLHPERVTSLGIAAVLLPERDWYQRSLLPSGPGWAWWFAFHSVPNVPDRLIAACLDFYFDTFYDLHDEGTNYDSSGITAADRAAYVAAYSGHGSLTAALGWFRAFPQDIEDNDGWLSEPLDLPYLALTEPHVHEAMSAQAGRIAREATVVKVEPSGHWVTHQQPGQVTDALLSFLSTEGPRP